MATQEETQRAQAEMAEKQFAKDVDKITELGKERFGAATFEHAVDKLVEKLGDGVRTFTAIASGFDSPHELVVRLSNDDNRLDAISKMSPNQAAVEIARMEAEISPNGQNRGGKEAAWRKLGKNSGILSDQEWGSGLADKLDEKAFQENWEHRQRQRAAKSPQPRGARRV